jgi:hypothetical protein
MMQYANNGRRAIAMTIMRRANVVFLSIVNVLRIIFDRPMMVSQARSDSTIDVLKISWSILIDETIAVQLNFVVLEYRIP